MKKALIYRWFARRANKKYFFGLLLLLLCWNLLLGFFSNLILGAHADTAKIPDLENGYSPAQLYQWWDLYGADGLWYYSLVNCCVDVLYPITYAAFGVLSLVILLEYSVPKLVNDLYQLSFFPVLVFAADMVENGLLFVALRYYPTRCDGIIQAASVATQAKWLGLVFFLTLVIIGLLTYFANGKEARLHLNKYDQF